MASHSIPDKVVARSCGTPERLYRRLVIGVLTSKGTGCTDKIDKPDVTFAGGDGTRTSREGVIVLLLSEMNVVGVRHNVTKLPGGVVPGLGQHLAIDVVFLIDEAKYIFANSCVNSGIIK